MDERQESVLGAGSAFFPLGVRTLDASGEERLWRGPTYVLPKETYKALLCTQD